MKAFLLALVLSGSIWAQCGKLVVNPSTGKPDCVGVGTTISIQANGGSPTAGISTLNVVNMISAASGSTATIQPDSAYFATNANVQINKYNILAQTSSSPTAYVGTLAYPLSGYSEGMTITWEPNISCTGGTTTTIQIGSLAAINVYQNDGSSNPTSAQCANSSVLSLTYQQALNAGAGGLRIMSGGGSLSNVAFTNTANTFTSSQTINIGTGTSSLNLGPSGASAHIWYNSNAFGGIGGIEFNSPCGYNLIVNSAIEPVQFGCINGTNSDPRTQFFGNIIAPLTTPASSSAACTAGTFADDANYHYVCTATNTWKRVALSTF